MSELQGEILTLQKMSGSVSTPKSLSGNIGVKTINIGGTTEIPIATHDTIGGIKIGDNLRISDDGVLSVETADAAEQDNTLPITSAAVYTAVGNIEVRLSTI